MNKILLCIISVVGISIHANDYKLPSVPKYRSKHIVTPSFQNPIHANDLSASANPQYTIKSSGRYYVVNDLSQEHNTAGGIILLVNANNVILDLNSKSIVPHISGSLSTGTGIAIARGKSNVQVMNGTIYATDTSGNQKLNNGIDLSETAVSGGSGTSYTIKIYNVFITRCKSNGVVGTAVNDFSIEGSSVNNCSGASEVVGVKLTSLNNLLIKNCEFNKNVSSGGDSYGIRLIDCSTGLVDSVHACRNNSTTTTAGVLIDYTSTGCDNITLKNINASSNNSSAGLAMGLSIVDSSLITIQDSIASNNTSDSVDGAAGISIRENVASAGNCKILNVQANENICTAHTAYGIIVESDNNHLENITASGNSSPANQTVAGIFLSSSNNNTLINCVANNNSNTNTGSSSSASAYGIAVVGVDNSITNSEARKNTTSANSTIRAVGMYASIGSNNRFENCICTQNNASHTTAAVTTAGIMFNSTENRSQIINCQSNNNFVGDGSSSGSSARAYGIYFGATTGTNKCLVKNCHIENNYAIGSGLAFGFYDNDTSSTALLIGNIAIGQGQCLGGILDASLQWNNNSEPTFGQNYFFKHAGTNSDPRDAIHEVPRENLVSLSTSVLKWQNISVYDAS
jgi:hypothetical protein